MQLFRLLAAILHLGNIVFYNDPSLPEGSPTSIKNRDVLETAANLLCLNATSLENALVYMSKRVGRELCSVVLDPHGASTQRDHLAETLYALTFSWLVEHINKRLCKRQNEFDTFIAVVEFPWIQSPNSTLASFDSLVSNCITERLFHLANTHHFDLPVSVMKDEGLHLDFIEYSDNQLTVDVFCGTERASGLWQLMAAQKSTQTESLASCIATALDSTLKVNPHYLASSTSDKRTSFGIKHFDECIEYDLESFVEMDAIMSDFVGLFRPTDQSSDDGDSSFISNLFSKSNGIRTVKSAKGRVLGATNEPMRNASIKHVTHSKNIFSAAEDSINDLIASFEGTRFWTIYSIPSTPEYTKLFCIEELSQATNFLDVDMGTGMTYTDFSTRYAPLLATTGASRGTSDPREIVKSFIMSLRWPTRETVLGMSKIYLSLAKWNWIAGEMGRIGGGDGEVDWSHLNKGVELNEIDDEENQSQYESEFQFQDLKASKVDIESGAAVPDVGKKEVIERVSEITASRKCWTCFTWSLTWWVPSFCMTWCGLKRPDIRMAWREKVAICVLIFFMCCALLFFIIGMRFVICPTVNVKSQSEVFSDRLLSNGGTAPFVSAYGRYYDVSSLMAQHIKDYGPGAGKAALSVYQFEAFYGRDVSNLFYKADLWSYYCPNLAAPPTSWDNLDPQLRWMSRANVNPSVAFHRGNSPAGYPQPFVESLNKYAKGKIGWAQSTIDALHSADRVFFV